MRQQTQQTQRNRPRSKFSLALIGAVLLIGGLVPSAAAGGREHHRHHSTCGCQAPEYAGKINIDGYSTRIRSDRPINRQISQAFRDAGYRSWISDGRVRVDYGCYRPNVRWSRDRHAASFNWSYGELGISVRRYYQPSRRNRGRYGPRRVARRTFGRIYCD